MNASFATAIGSGFQLTYSFTWAFSLSANKSSLIGPNCLLIWLNIWLPSFQLFELFSITFRLFQSTVWFRRPDMIMLWRCPFSSEHGFCFCTWQEIIEQSLLLSTQMHLCDAVSLGHSICPPPSFASIRGNDIPTPAEMHGFLLLDLGSVSEFASRSTVPVVGSTRKSLSCTDLSGIFLLDNSVMKKTFCLVHLQFSHIQCCWDHCLHSLINYVIRDF